MRVSSINQLQFFRNLTEAGGRFSASVEKLSTGVKVARAGQDPSAHGIINEIKSDTSGLSMAEKNIQDGISFLQMRDAAMSSIEDILVKLKEMAVRASTDATLTDEQRKSLNEEASALVSEINRVNDATTFNNIKVFNLNFETVPGYGGPYATNHPGQVSFSVDLASIAATNGGVVNIYSSWYDGFANFPDLNIVSPDGTEAFGYLYGAFPQPGVESYVSGGGVQSVSGGLMGSATQVDYSGWAGYVGAGGWDEESFTVTDPAPGSWTIIIDNENPSDITFGVFFNEPAVEPQDKDNLQVAPNTNADSQYSVGFYEVDSVALGLSANLATAASAQSSIDSIDSAIEELSGLRTDDGAKLQELERMLAENSNQIINNSAAESRLRDTDFSSEITNFTRSIITSQAATSMINNDVQRLQTAASTLLSHFN